VLRVLLTGFEPFGGESVNPSWEAVRLVAADPPPGVDLRVERLPCVFDTVAATLLAAAAAHRADVVLCVGQAGGRAEVAVERVAVNLADARIPDNAGAQPADAAVVPGGPAAYFATVPVKACVAAARRAGVPTVVSHSAGTFVCNAVLYAALHAAAAPRVGFVHVPYAPQQVTGGGQPSLPVATVAAALRAIVAAAGGPDDAALPPEGATH
jgi:pyroglutamyl-peptidase